MKIAYVFFNGILEKEKIIEKNFYKNFIENNKGDIFCADGGANVCYEWGIVPKEIWGDLDSISEESLNFYEKKDVVIKKFLPQKNMTDSELILEKLKKEKYEKIYCIATLGGTIQHELTNINLLFKYKNLIFLNRKETIFRIEAKKEFVFKNLKNTEISFIIFSENIKLLSLRGLKYNLEKKDFQRGETRLVSNLIVENFASIYFSYGEIICILENKI